MNKKAFINDLEKVLGDHITHLGSAEVTPLATHLAAVLEMMHAARLLRLQPAIIDAQTLHNTKLCFTPFLDLLPLPEGAEIPEKYFVNVALMTGVITALMAGEALGDALQHLDGQIGTLSLGMQSTVDNMLVPIRQRHLDARNLALTYEKMLIAEGGYK